MRILLVGIFTCLLFTRGVLSYGAANQPQTPRGPSPERTITYTVVITYHPKKTDKTDLTGTSMTTMRYWIKGNRWRKEEIWGEIRRITIVSEGWRYFLMPETKTGNKIKVKEPIDPFELRDPTKLLTEWQKKGAKRVGSQKLNGQECDVYEKSPLKKEEPKVKIWARKRDNMVVKIEEDPVKLGLFTSPKEFIAVHKFKDVRVGAPIDNSLFAAPRDYQIEEK